MENKLYYYAIPKTGSTYFESCIKKSSQKTIDRVKVMPHGVFSKLERKDIQGQANITYNCKWELPKDNNAIKFSVVRNPFDYLVSYFYHGKYGYADVKKFHGSNFEEFIENFCDENVKWHFPPKKEFLFFHLFNDLGECQVDFVIRQEFLQKGIKLLNKEFDLDIVIINEKINASMRRNNESYMNFYNDEMINKVSVKCRQELESFKYSFGATPNDIIIDTTNSKIRL